MKRLAALPLIALVAACRAEPADEADPVAPPAPGPSASAVGSRTVGASGVGPISATTPFDRDAIAALFPGSRVESEFLHLGEATQPIVTVTGPEDIALEIQGAPDGAVGQVIVSGGPFTGPGGAALLAAWPELGLTAGDCTMGEGRFVGRPVCRQAGAPNLAYVLSVPAWRGSDLPDPTTLNGRARLAEYVWAAP